jgi:glycyl-tRNA synthetase (class II)
VHAPVWKAAGHIENFHDLLVECKVCHQRFRYKQGHMCVCARMRESLSCTAFVCGPTEHAPRVCRADKLAEEHGVEGAGALSAAQLEATIKERDLKPSQCVQKGKPCTYTGAHLHRHHQSIHGFCAAIVLAQQSDDEGVGGQTCERST